MKSRDAETAEIAAYLPKPPEAYRRFRAPGRVNLIGEHTDYNDGFVLPVAIQLECVLEAVPAPRMELETTADVDPAWRRYPQAVGRLLGGGLRGVVDSTVPPGAGLGSSAALEVACALALRPDLPRLELAQVCRRAEEEATGVPCGVMDQLASLCGVAGHALLIDCRTLEVRPVLVPPELAFVVVHSGVRRELAASEYAQRRAECERTARALGLRALRDASPAEVAGVPLARHVVAENARVLDAADALAAADLDRLGRLFLLSHASLRDDFRVSTPELDRLVDELVAAGASGARLTGAGFGGCAVAVSAPERVARVLDAVRDHYPLALEVHASAGAGTVD